METHQETSAQSQWRQITAASVLLGSPWPEARRNLFSEGGSAKAADPPGIVACAVFPFLIGN